MQNSTQTKALALGFIESKIKKFKSLCDSAEKFLDDEDFSEISDVINTARYKFIEEMEKLKEEVTKE